MAAQRTAFCDLRIKDILPYLSGLVLVLCVCGYIGGFIVVDLSLRRRKNDALEVSQQSHLTLSDEPDTNEFHPAGKEVISKAPEKQLQKFTPSNVATDEKAVDDAVVPRCTAQCSTPVQQSGRSNTNGQWIEWNFNSFQFYAYSAFFDNRPSLELDTSQNFGLIRIIALSTRLLDKNTYEGLPFPSDIFCELCYEDGSVVRAKVKRGSSEPKPMGYGWTIDGQKLREYIYTCNCPGNKLPTAVTLKQSTTKSTDHQCLPVELAERRGIPRPVAICAGVINVLPDPYRLIEWLELQRLMGVSTVIIYTMGELNNTAPAHKVLDYYSSPSTDMFLNLRVTSLIGSSRDTGQHVLHSSPVINDCIYRYMYQYRYIMVVDVDELIVPTNSSENLPQLMNRLQEMFPSRLPPNFIFWNSFHFLDDSPDIAVSPYMTILRYRRKAPLSEYGHNVKSIVDPRSCISMHNQYCWTLTPAIAKANTPLEFVSPSIAVKQAYRLCDLGSVKCASLFGSSVIDDTLSTLRQQLVETMRNRVKNIIGHDI